MAKQKGIIKIKGTLNGLCYYKLNGVDIVRKATGPSKERIQNDPAFVKVKGNAQEFAAAVYLAKSMIMGLGPLAKAFKDSYMQSRLTGVCRKIIQKGAGIQGQRDANLLNDPKNLIGFQLHKEKPLNQILTSTPQVTSNSERNLVTITIQKEAYQKMKNLTKKGRQLKLRAAVCWVSPYQWNNTLERYQPLHPDQNGLGFNIESTIEIINVKSQDIQLQLNTKSTPPVSARL
ncbi:hypothetical protein [Yeosuana sp. AK3]